MNGTITRRIKTKKYGETTNQEGVMKDDYIFP